MLAILDGWGERDETEGNGIKLANIPNIDHWRATRPWTLLGAAEKNVGLPPGQMGNSEVGHLNLGAGFVVMQDITLIDDSIADGSFFENDALNAAVQHVRERGTQLHIIGLLGTGGVHSHMNHEKAMLELARRNGLDQGLRPRLHRRARHHATQRPRLYAGARSLYGRDRRRARRNGDWPLLRHGPRQALGAHQVGL